MEAISAGSGIGVPASVDELTGLSDRRSFFERADQVFAEALQGEARCAAVVIDLDRLEHVNDTYGHHVGSELIREAAAALSSVALDGDVLGRLGGDELALFRCGGAVSAGELEAQISAEVARASRSDRPYGLAVSVGVAVGDAAAIESLDALLLAADEDMYRHKQSRGGRKRGAHVRTRPRD